MTGKPGINRPDESRDFDSLAPRLEVDVTNPTVPSLRRIAFVGNYVPRQCGIATFTTDLCEAVAASTEEASCFVIAVTDKEEGYDYPERVRLELNHHDLLSYRRAADFLNLSDVDTVCLQHEFGIYGGQAGSHILTLLREVRMPVITTLHTVLQNPDRYQRQVLEEVTRLSDRVVVMSQRAVDYLTTIYRVPAEKIDLIPHGIPDVPFVDPNFYKDKFGIEGKTALLTFGLLSPNKGIEHVLRALPAIKAQHPDVVYLVLGATHPHVRRDRGEEYRQSLQQLARELDVEQNVQFIDRFVSLEELIEYIGAADIYVTPYLNAQQIVSGTLAYTVGAGKAVVSTPYWYAEELLDEERGLLASFADPQSLADQILYLLDHETECHAMRKRAYLFGREMTWPKVAQRYLESFERARTERLHRPRTILISPWARHPTASLPPLNLEHLWRMTDSTGLLQHAIYTSPNYAEGYTTDDNARALAVGVFLEQTGDSFTEARMLMPRYLSFLHYAFNADVGRFRNFMSYDRRWLEELGSEDSHGRALQYLGLVLGRSDQDDWRGIAIRLFEAALPGALALNSPRAWAFSLVGVHEYLSRFSGDRMAHQVLATLAERLLQCYQDHASPEWSWFEPSLTYCNAILPHALLVSGYRLSRPDMLEAAFQSLQWLIELQRSPVGHFTPIGCNGFCPQDGERARFDQQPVEAHCLLSACIEAWRITGDPAWGTEAEWAFEWFLGRNDLGVPLYNPFSGGCHDGLHPDRLNQNQGAESTLAYLLSYLELRQMQRTLSPAIETTVPDSTLLQLETAASSLDKK
jgi:glycosyltransferase involved in cell wall biosynthesis